MAYTVAQLRKNGNLNYMQPVNISNREVFPENNPYTNVTNDPTLDSNFYDLALVSSGLSGANVGFQEGQVYYLRFKVRCIPEYFYSKQEDQNHDADVLRLVILLKKHEDGAKEEDDATIGTLLYQQVGTCTIPTALSSSLDISLAQYTTFSFIFTPIQNYDTLIFRVQRTAYDVLTLTRNWLVLDLCKNQVPNHITLSAKEQDLIDTGVTDIFFCLGNNETEGDLARLQNLVPQSESGNNKWYKFGYQGRPGNLLVVNQLPIRVGRSGIYEFNNGLLVNSFMIAQPNGNVDAFLLDYAYESN